MKYILYVGYPNEINEIAPSGICYTTRFEKLKFFDTRGSGIIDNLYWRVINKSVFLFEILNEAGKVLHHSYIMKKSYKFPFMSNCDYMIGPSVTSPEQRGQGLYPFAISCISKKVMKLDNNARLVALVREENLSSSRAMLKAGMKDSMKRYEKNKMKIYYEVQKRNKA